MPQIENLAEVLEVQDQKLRLTTTSPSGCARCDRGEGCGGGILGKLIQRRLQGLQLDDPGLNLQVGQVVVLGLESTVFLQATLLIYLMPLVLLLVAAGAVQWLGGADAAVAMAGLAGLVAGAVFAPGLRRRYIDARLQPRVLRRAQPQDIRACQ